MPRLSGRFVVSDFHVGDRVVFRAGRGGLEVLGKVEQLGREVLYVSLSGGQEAVVKPDQVTRIKQAAAA